MDVVKNGNVALTVDDDGQVLSSITGRVVKKIVNNEGGATIIDAATGREEFFIPGGLSGGTDTSDATAKSSDVSSGMVFYGPEGKETGTMPDVSPTKSGNVVTIPAGRIRTTQNVTVGTTQSAKTYTPGTSNKTIPAGTYISGNQTIKGDADLTAGNIKIGVSIFDVAGTFTADATATAAEIADGMIAYANGQKIIGSGKFNFYKCASVDANSHTWLGYKAIFMDGIYSFESTLSSLSYGDSFTPAVGGIYNDNCLVQVKSLYTGVDLTMVFYASLAGASNTAETGQAMSVSGSVEYMDLEGRACAYFDGDSKLVISDVSALPFGSTQHTICGWFRYSEFAQFRGLLGYGYEYAIRATSDYGGCDVVYYSNTGGAFSYSLEAERWYHIATTWDGSKIVLYINGIKEAENSNEPNFYRSESNPLWIGGVPRTGTAHGYVSDVRIYTRALSDEEIAALAAE